MHLVTHWSKGVREVLNVASRLREAAHGTVYRQRIVIWRKAHCFDDFVSSRGVLRRGNSRGKVGDGWNKSEGRLPFIFSSVARTTKDGTVNSSKTLLEEWRLEAITQRPHCVVGTLKNNGHTFDMLNKPDKILTQFSYSIIFIRCLPSALNSEIIPSLWLISPSILVHSFVDGRTTEFSTRKWVILKLPQVQDKWKQNRKHANKMYNLLSTHCGLLLTAQRM